MAETANGDKALESRLAAVEEKLAKIFITEEEMKAYLKVRALLGCEPAVSKPEATVGSACQCATTRAVGLVINRDIINHCNGGASESSFVEPRYGVFLGTNI